MRRDRESDRCAHCLKRAFLISCLLLSGLVISPDQALAEIRAIRGLSIFVDQISPVDEHNTRISFEGRVFIVQNAAVDSTILTQVLQNQAAVQKLALPSLIEFTRTAFEQNDVVAAQGIFALLSHRDITLEQVHELLLKTAESPALIQGLKKVIQDPLSWGALHPDLRAAVLVELGVADAQWVQQSASISVVNNRDGFHRYAKGAFTDAIKSRKFARLPLLASLLKDLFGVEDPLFQECRLVSDQLSRFHQALETIDINTLEITLVSLRNDETLRTTVYPYLVEEIHRVARQEIDRNRPLQALELLSLMDLSFRTATTHSLLKLALERLPTREVSILDRSMVKRFLLAMAQYDETLTIVLRKRLEGLFRSAVYEGSLNQAERALETLIILRPDPDRENDELRIFYAQVLRDHNQVKQSQAQLKNVKTGIPFMVRLELFSLDTLGISLKLLMLLIVSGVLFLVLALGRLLSSAARSRTARGKAPQGYDRDHEQEDDEEREGESGKSDDAYAGPVFRRMDSPKISPERKEYLQCLTVFHLESQATFKEIRHAYRTAVKEHHPDRHAEGFASDRFVNLNQTYERILELRKLLGMGTE